MSTHKANCSANFGMNACSCAADESAKPVYQARARGVEQQWSDVNHNGFLAALAMRSMEVRILYDAPLNPAPVASKEAVTQVRLEVCAMAGCPVAKDLTSAAKEAVTLSDEREVKDLIQLIRKTVRLQDADLCDVLEAKVRTLFAQRDASKAD